MTSVNFRDFSEGFLGSAFTLGRTSSNVMAIINPIAPTVKKGAVNPPNWYKKAPIAGPVIKSINHQAFVILKFRKSVPLLKTRP